MPPEGLRRWTTVFDMIYNPPMTRLLREAATRGCHTISGMEMFVGQAEAQHRLWHGSPAAPGVMRTALSG
jgi:shikimate 5-dehydrogenase